MDYLFILAIVVAACVYVNVQQTDMIWKYVGV